MKQTRLDQYDYGMAYAYTRREQDKDATTGGWNTPMMKAARAIRDTTVAELTAQGFSALQISKKMGRGYSTQSVVRARRRLNVDVSHLKTSTKAFCKRGHRRPPGTRDCKPCGLVRWHEQRCKCHERDR